MLGQITKVRKASSFRRLPSHQKADWLISPSFFAECPLPLKRWEATIAFKSPYSILCVHYLKKFQPTCNPLGKAFKALSAADLLPKPSMIKCPPFKPFFAYI